MKPRSVVLSVLLSLLCVAAFWANHSQSSSAQQRDQPAPRRCVGVATAVLRTDNPVIVRIYRVFDDGAVETYDDGAPGAAWMPRK